MRQIRHPSRPVFLAAFTAQLPSRLFRTSTRLFPRLETSRWPIPQSSAAWRVCWPIPPFPYLHLVGFMRCMREVCHHLSGVCFFRELASLSDFPTTSRRLPTWGCYRTFQPAKRQYNGLIVPDTTPTAMLLSPLRLRRSPMCWSLRYSEETGQSALRSVPAAGQCFADWLPA